MDAHRIVALAPSITVSASRYRSYADSQVCHPSFTSMIGKPSSIRRLDASKDPRAAAESPWRARTITSTARAAARAGVRGSQGFDRSPIRFTARGECLFTLARPTGVKTLAQEGPLEVLPLVVTGHSHLHESGEPFRIYAGIRAEQARLGRLLGVDRVRGLGPASERRPAMLAVAIDFPEVAQQGP